MRVRKRFTIYNLAQFNANNSAAQSELSASQKMKTAIVQLW